jgi:hypothetical protein
MDVFVIVSVIINKEMSEVQNKGWLEQRPEDDASEAVPR